MMRTTAPNNMSNGSDEPNRSEESFSLHESTERTANMSIRLPETDYNVPDDSKSIGSKKPKGTTMLQRAQMLNMMGMPWAILTIISAAYYGTFMVVPQIYLGWSEWWIAFVQGLFWFMLLEVIVNWYFLRTVTSYFSVSLCSRDEIQRHGEKSDKSAREIHNPNNKELPEQSELDSEISVRYKGERFVTVPIPDDKGKTKYMMYPYFSWRPCVACNVYRPPRAHHCPLCRRCVLKRDHHCFFSGSCVGLHNQRFFVVFTFWAMLLAGFAFLHASMFLIWVIWDQISYWDLFYPATMVRWMLGYTEFTKVIWILIYYSLVFMIPASVNYFREQCKLIYTGVTSYEKDEDVKIVDLRSIGDKFRAVLGENWLITFLVPMHTVFPVKDDGIRWPALKSTSS